MSIYLFQTYQEAIRDFVETQKKLGTGLNYSRLAASIGIQKSYLSQALAGKCHFNSDQLYLACKLMRLNPDETHYLLKLLEMQRTQITERKEQLKQEVEHLRHQQEID